jgi:hypothetical protein
LWAAGTGLVVLFAGLLLVRGRRRLVLFLRRFGDTDATHAATVATGRMGGSWRLVTMDDARIAPLGVNAAARTFMGAANAFTATVEIATAASRIIGKVFKFVMIAAAWGTGAAAVLTGITAPGNIFERIIAVFSLVNLAQPSGGAPGDLFRACVYVLIVGAVLFLAWTALSLSFTVLVLPFLSFLMILQDGIAEAEWLKRLVIEDIKGIVFARSAIRRISRRVLSPRLTVLAVDSDLWQLAVGGLAVFCAVPLIDVSEPTENVLWEIEQMTQRFGARCVFVGDYERVLQLTEPTAAGSMWARQQQLLDGYSVLAYTNDQHGVSAFSRALRATLERAVRLPAPRVRPPDPITRQMTDDIMRQLRQEARDKARAARRGRRR